MYLCAAEGDSAVVVLTLQISKLQETNRALDRLTKSKEAALIESERVIKAAEAKASMVDDLQNRNQELLKQIEICQVRGRERGRCTYWLVHGRLVLWQSRTHVMCMWIVCPESVGRGPR